jgi:molybdate transport system substrate-binding protein
VTAAAAARWIGGTMLLLAACGRTTVGPPPVHVAAAADLARAFPEVAARFTRDTGTPVVFTFGSSGLLARQLAQGGPWDAFASADEVFVEQAVAAGACDAATRARYARGRLVVWWREPPPVAPPATLEELADGRFARVAIAQPEHAPYGRAAREALQGAGVWTALAPRVVFGENVRQALQFAASGNAQAALVARSLVDARGGWFEVPASMHAPLDQAIVACRTGGSPEGGSAWVRFVTSPPAQAILREHGFDPPAGH